MIIWIFSFVSLLSNSHNRSWNLELFKVDILTKIKRRTRENVLGELMSFLFTPHLIFKFNMTGKFNCHSFKILKIYKILQGNISAFIVKSFGWFIQTFFSIDVMKFDNKTHKTEMTRVIHNMHQIVYNARIREKKKRIREAEDESD